MGERGTQAPLIFQLLHRLLQLDVLNIYIEHPTASYASAIVLTPTTHNWSLKL